MMDGIKCLSSSSLVIPLQSDLDLFPYLRIRSELMNALKYDAHVIHKLFIIISLSCSASPNKKMKTAT